MTERRPSTMTPLAWTVVAVGIFGFVAAVIWLAVTPAPLTGSLLGDNPTAAIVAVAGLLAALGSPVVSNLVAVRRQVQNSHEVNLRDDLDEKQDETRELLATSHEQQTRIIAQLEQIAATLRDHGGAIIGLRQDLRHLREVDRDTGRDLAEVRRTAADLDQKLDAHLEWSREYVQNQQQKDSQ